MKKTYWIILHIRDFRHYTLKKTLPPSGARMEYKSKKEALNVLRDIFGGKNFNAIKGFYKICKVSVSIAPVN